MSETTKIWQSPETRVKIDTESEDFTFDFTELLQGTEQVSSVISVSAYPPSELTIGTPAIATGSKKVNVRIGDGQAGTDYVVSMLVLTSLNNKPQIDGRLQVRNSQ